MSKPSDMPYRRLEVARTCLLYTSDAADDTINV